MQARKRPDDYDRTDLAASALLKEWGASTDVKLVKPEPCERRHCGGSHLLGFMGCMLCGREA
jgi:hypothetical protein